jgi:hypothetical protein
MVLTPKECDPSMIRKAESGRQKAATSLCRQEMFRTFHHLADHPSQFFVFDNQMAAGVI